MVHRPADSRLLTNLLSHEKDYTKHLLSLLDYSHASLSSFTAYAAASPPPTSQVILSVAGHLSSADDALRRYAASIDQWREMMKNLKILEDDVGNIMRDREILVTRLIKASKSHKPPNNRDSLLLSHQRYPSSSSLSVQDSLSPAPGSGPAPGTYAPGLNTSSKLAAAQAELQACEAHLAAKEQELAARRSSTIKDGLTIRCTAMSECGWIWNECGKEALKALEALVNGNNGNTSILNGDNRLSLVRRHSVPLPQTFPLSDDKPLPPPGAGSDISSIGPSQSASQVNLTLPPPVPPPPIPGYPNYSNGDANSSPQSGSLNNGNTKRNSYQDTHKSFHIPPAHAIDELTMPTSTSTPIRHELCRRITEEDISRPVEPVTQPQETWVNQLDVTNNGQSTTENGSESEDEAAELARGELSVIENPRFAPPTPPDTNIGAATPNTTARVQSQAPATTMTGSSQPSPVKERKGSFFGSIKGFFGGKSGKDREREVRGRKRIDSDDEVRASEEEELKTLHARLGRLKGKTQGDAEPSRGGLFGMGGRSSVSASSGGWETRTDKNLRKLSRKESDEDLTSVPRTSGHVSLREPAFEPVLMDDAAGAGVGRMPSKPRGRARVASEGGKAIAKTESVGPAGGGKKLRKQRGSRSSSVPPISSSTPPSITSASVPSPRIVRPGESDSEEKPKNSPTTSTGRAEEWVEKQTALNTRANAVHSPTQPSAPEPNRIATGGKGNAISDSPSPPLSKPTPAGVSRQKSLTKSGSGAKNASGLAPAVFTGGGAIVVTDSSKANNVAGLSRNSSMLSSGSSRSAPAKHQRSASTTGTAADFGRVQTPTGLGMGMPTTSIGRRPSGSAAPNRPAHRRSMSVDLGTGGASNLSLTRTASTSGGAGRNTTYGNGVSLTSAMLPTSRKPAELETVKAPPRVGRQDIINYDKSSLTRNIMMIEVPKAPRSVVDLLRSGDIEGGSDVDSRQQERRRSIGGTVKEGSASAPDLTSNGNAKPAPRSTKTPLRSALRNTSRSPSPQVNGISSRIIVPLTPTIPASPSIQPGRTLEGTLPSTLPPPPVSAVLPWEKKSFKGKEAATQDDVSSISSYETGREVFYSDADDTNEEPVSQHWAVSAVPGSDLQPVQSSIVPGASDISTSTASTSTVSPLPHNTLSLLGMSQDPIANSTPVHHQRRKSVRVSLQPTFSPTPPAIDDDDEDEQQRHAPWAWKNESGSSKQTHKTISDVWEDSSEEDVEYQKAKRLLSRIGKKEKAR